VPLPVGAAAPDAVRFKAFTLPPRTDAPPPSGPVAVTLTRVNRVFMLDQSYLPMTSLFSWSGRTALAVDRDWVELEIAKR
jgi:hypothetical protein